MSLRIISKGSQAYGAFNGGQIVENKPIGFPQDGGFVRPYSNLFYWARAKAVIDSTIGLHPHQGFEIMSFVLEGKIRHFDTKMNDWKELEAGSAQIIRAGNGIKHAEHMYKGAVMFQIWVDPNLAVTMEKEASYDDYTAEQLPVERNDAIELISYAGGDGPMKLDADLQIQKLTVLDDYTLDLSQEQITSIYVIKGSGSCNGDSIDIDDYIISEDLNQLQFSPVNGPLELFVVHSPKNPGYSTYAEMMQARMT